MNHRISIALPNLLLESGTLLDSKHMCEVMQDISATEVCKRDAKQTGLYRTILDVLDNTKPWIGQRITPDA
jgi:hypothetical protein